MVLAAAPLGLYWATGNRWFRASTYSTASVIRVANTWCPYWARSVSS